MSADSASQVADRERHVEVATGLRLWVREWGSESAPPLLILHGGGQSGAHWAPVASLLGQRRRCIVPDARGHGGSDWSEPGDYACADQVADLESLVAVLGLDRPALAGHSMGGLNALLLAGRAPGLVSALVLIDVGTESRKAGLDRVLARGLKAPPAPPEGAARPSFDTRLLAHVPTYCGDDDARRRLLAAAEAPLLVLRGAHSRILSLQSARQTADLVGGRMQEIPDAGHDVASANPAAVAEAIGDFLDDLDPR